MDYQNDRSNNNFQRKPMQDVSDLGITCSDCGTPINELPFAPNKREDGTYGRLFCYNCNKKRKGDRPRTGGFGGGDRGGFRRDR